MLIILLFFSADSYSQSIIIPTSSDTSSSKDNLPSEHAVRPKVGLALSGGGAKGFAHIGVLKVLEEAGLHIDVISGTSMGAIVGALYSIGYSTAELESLVTTTDWVELFNDVAKRQDVAMELKEQTSKYAISLPLSGWEVALPTGVIAGQNVGNLLAGLTWRVHHVNNFRDLPIPFSCVATDLQTGEAVVLDNGYLSEAIRASFAIPSILTPVKMGNKLLIDGFVARNLPAQDAIDLGADIVIGVDVGRAPMKPDQITSLIDVINQTMSLQGENANKEQRLMCDYLISPDVSETSILDFAKPKELIKKGEDAAREFLPQIKALVDSLNAISSPPYHYKPISGDSLRIVEIEIEGLKKTTKKLVLGLMDISLPEVISKARLNMNIDRVYSSQLYERVTYQTLPVPGGTILRILVVEKNADQLRIGFHYDSEDKAAVLVNVTLHNKILKNSLFTTDFRLGNDYGSIFSYTKYLAFRPRIGINISISSMVSDLMMNAKNIDPDVSSLYIIPYSLSNDVMDIFFGSLFSTRTAVGVGIQMQSLNFSVKNVSSQDAKRLNQTFDTSSAYLAFIFDTLNRIYFPTEGLFFRSIYNYGYRLEDKKDMLGDKVISREFQAMAAFPVSTKLTFVYHSILGITDSGDIAFPKYSLGGYDSFFGMKSGEMDGDSIYTTRISIQYEPWKRKFIVLGFDYGMAGTHIKLVAEEFESGVGVTLGMLTPLGPVQWAAHSGSGSGAETFLRIGYVF